MKPLVYTQTGENAHIVQKKVTVHSAQEEARKLVKPQNWRRRKNESVKAATMSQGRTKHVPPLRTNDTMNRSYNILITTMASAFVRGKSRSTYIDTLGDEHSHT